jgi:hypothetical protein
MKPSHESSQKPSSKPCKAVNEAKPEDITEALLKA